MQRLHSILISLLIAAVALSFFFLVFSQRGLIDQFNLKQEVARLQQKNSDLEKENDRLRRTVQRLLEDPAYIENVARTELGMIGQDEIIYDFKNKNARGKK